MNVTHTHYGEHMAIEKIFNLDASTSIEGAAISDLLGCNLNVLDDFCAGGHRSHCSHLKNFL